MAVRTPRLISSSPRAAVDSDVDVVRLNRWDLWQPGLGVVDVTNPSALRWYEEKLDALIDLGVDTFKVSVVDCLPSRLLSFALLFACSRCLRCLVWCGVRPTSESGSRTRTLSSTMGLIHCAYTTRTLSSITRWYSDYWNDGLERGRPSCLRAPRLLVGRGMFCLACPHTCMHVC